MALPKLTIPLDLPPMEARLVEALPEEPGWQFEPKWDGFRCLAFRYGDAVELRGKSGKSLARYFPEVVAALRSLPPTRFVLDGELAVPRGASLSFDALQARLHPAPSRIVKLARETPAVLIVFDLLLAPAGKSLLDAPLRERRAELELFVGSLGRNDVLRLTPCVRSRPQAQRWLQRAGDALDGVIAKPLDAPYAPGERAMRKVKRLRTADCVVGGFRYGKDSREVGSLLLGLYNDAGTLDHVGFTASLAGAERRALTRRLEAQAGPPGFTGDAPGGPSRWSTERSAEWTPLKPKFVVEVCYDHVTGHRFRHGTRLLRWRPDKAPRQCTFEQLAPPARLRKLMTLLRQGAR